MARNGHGCCFISNMHLSKFNGISKVSYTAMICDWILKTYYLNTSKLFEETQLKISFYKINFILHFTKQLLNLFAVNFHTKSFFFLGDMDDCIRLTNVAKIRSHIKFALFQSQKVLVNQFTVLLPI